MSPSSFHSDPDTTVSSTKSQNPNGALVSLGLVGAGGAAGALARWAIVSAQPQFREAATIMAINIAGSMLLGFLLGRREVRRATRELLGTGFAGGFTTFSTFAVDVARRLDRGDWALAGVNIVATALLALLAAGLGYRLGRTVDRFLYASRRRRR